MLLSLPNDCIDSIFQFITPTHLAFDGRSHPHLSHWPNLTRVSRSFHAVCLHMIPLVPCVHLHLTTDLSFDQCTSISTYLSNHNHRINHISTPYNIMIGALFGTLMDSFKTLRTMDLIDMSNNMISWITENTSLLLDTQHLIHTLYIDVYLKANSTLLKESLLTWNNSFKTGHFFVRNFKKD